jgi:hypothetical protein
MAISLRAFASFMLCRSPNFDAVGAFVSVVNVNFETFSDQFHRLSIFQNHRSLLRLAEAFAVSARMRIRLSQSEEERNQK